MTSVFNPSQFLNITVAGGERFDTSRVPPPEGEYFALVSKVAGRELKLDGGETRPIMAVSWELEDEGKKIHAITGREKNIVGQDIFLDITPTGELDRGKGMNPDLGRLLEALGLNGKQWSPMGLQGLRAKVLVTHRTTPDGNVMAQIRKVMSQRETAA